MKFERTIITTLVAAALSLSAAASADQRNEVGVDKVQIGADNNSALNPFVQPQDPAQAGGGRDQSLRFGDVLHGSRGDDLQIGLLGSDLLFGNSGDDVQVGGLEHFAAGNNIDRAFGGRGRDIFVWKPGDASDFFAGGRGTDAVIFGLVGEPDGDGGVQFELVNNGQAGEVFIDPDLNLPLVDVTNSPGFCEVIDRHSSPEAADELAALGLDHLVQFFIRAQADNGDADGDNGLRVTLHLNNVEILVCTNRDGGEIEIVDLRYSPPRLLDVWDIRPRKLRERISAMIQ